MRHLDELSREELYDLVWSEALARLAPKFGISDVALKKPCNKLGIPTPGRGYWAKVEAGQSLKRSKLPADIPARPKFKRKTFPDSMVYFRVEGADYASRRPHEVTVATRLSFRERYTGQHETLRSWGESARIEVSQASLQRALWILDHLLKSVERIGLVVQARSGYDGGAFVVLGREEAQIIIREKVRRFDNPDYDPKKKVGVLDRAEVYLFKPCGLLRVKVKFGYSSEKEWMDSSTAPLDGQIDDIAQAIKLGLEECAVRREASRLAEIRREEARRAEWERQKLREAEEQRRRELEKLAQSLAASEQVRGLADAVECALKHAQVDTNAPPAAEWLGWAREHAARLDPVARIAEQLRHRELSRDSEPTDAKDRL